MYSGFSVANGSLVGRITTANASLELGDAIETLGAEESVIGQDENGEPVFISSMIDPSNGEIAWLPVPDTSFIKLKTLCQSQMSSMLRDERRNEMYAMAIQRSIQAFQQHFHRNPVVLDIGTGTGLLAMLAIRFGAEYVFAVEMFDLLAETATENVLHNQMADKIMIINAKSSDIEDLPIKVDIIVSELLDTALLGEGIIPSHGDAITRFLSTEDYEKYPIENRVIPHSAEIFASLVESQLLHDSISIAHIATSTACPSNSNSNGQQQPGHSMTLYRDSEHSPSCPSGVGVLPIHWSRSGGSGRCLSYPPVSSAAVEFWHDNPFLQTNGGYAVFDSEVICREAGVVNGVLLTWKCHLLSPQLDPGRAIIYSTSPFIDSNSNNSNDGSVMQQSVQFQDHWRQGVIPSVHPIAVSGSAEGEVLTVRLCHDDLRVWVFVSPQPLMTPMPVLLSEQQQVSLPVTGKKRGRFEDQLAKRSLSCRVPREWQIAFAPPQCTCGWHILHDTCTTQAMNDYDYRLAFMLPLVVEVTRLLLQQSQAQHQQQQTIRILDAGDGGITAIQLACALRERQQFQQAAAMVKIVSRERKQFSALFYNSLIAANDLEEDEDSAVCVEIEQQLQQEGDEGSYDMIIWDITRPVLYGLWALPLWQALHILYAARQLLLKQQSILSSRPAAVRLRLYPQGARIMAMPFTSNQLMLSHGPLRQPVQGWCDHTAYDQRLEGWWTSFLYPYSLGDYEVMPSTAMPTEVYRLDYRDGGVDAMPAEVVTNIEISSMPMTVFTAAAGANAVDGVALFVEWILDFDRGVSLSPWQPSLARFKTHSVQSVKFFDRQPPPAVCRGLTIKMGLEPGASDFDMSFQLSYQ